VSLSEFAIARVGEQLRRKQLDEGLTKAETRTFAICARAVEGYAAAWIHQTEKRRAAEMLSQKQSR